MVVNGRRLAQVRGSRTAKLENPMCQRVQCATCGKPTWVGCGKHIEQVLGDVPPDQRCQCLRKSLWQRLLGR